MPAIFISYRREDSAGYAGRMHEELEGRLGPDQVFRDADTLRAGQDFEDAIRLGISLGGDSDTLACITGGVAEAFYGGVPKEIELEALSRLDARLRDVTVRFRARYP